MPSRAPIVDLNRPNKGGGVYRIVRIRYHVRFGWLTNTEPTTGLLNCDGSADASRRFNAVSASHSR
jgi:hypothetical protein